MKTSLLLAALLSTAALALATNTASACGAGCGSESSSAKMAATATAAEAAYPLDTCIVSGEKLGEMGAPIDYIHKEAGKPDRLVRFCCKMCIKKFEKDPAKYVKLLDEAAAQKKA